MLRMNLAHFILTNLEPILVEWEAFAKSLPAGVSMTPRALRDDAERMLRFVAADLATFQTVDEGIAKSHGHGEHLRDGKQSAAHDHGLQRLADGFDLVQMVSEYRALRASVTRLWAQEVNAFDHQALEMIRFNEAMDQILAESVERFTEKVGRDRDLFLAVLGHDLRNPLSTIKMGSALLLRSSAITARDYNSAVTISRSADRMGQMVHDLLDFTRTRLGARLPISAERCDLSTICDRIAEEMRTAHPDRSISVECDGDCAGQWDPSRIEQLVSNLVGNAVQHGYRGTAVAIILEGSQTETVTVGVLNHGPAVPESQRRSIFDPLTRGVDPEVQADADHRTSLGLGLYIAREIASAHGGTIDVTSSEIEGTMFRVVLPRYLPS
jgi:signal transduction histidine kinase